MTSQPFKVNIIAFAILAVLISCSSSGPRTVNNPFINFSNTTTLGISQVDMTDSSTVLTVDAHFRPKWWIRIVSDSYIQAEGKKYAMTGAQGIVPDSLFYMPESGESQFRLFFEPLPFSTKKFDFIEGDSENAFRLLSVDLTGKDTPRNPQVFPKQLIKPVKNNELPAPVFEIGRTTIDFHLVPSNVGLQVRLTLYVNTLSGKQDEIKVKFDKGGNGSVSFDQYGTVSAFAYLEIGSTTSASKITLQPGEKIDCYINTRVSGIGAMNYRKNFSMSDYIRSLHTGIFKDINRLDNNYINPYRFEFYSGSFADYRSTNKEYMEMVKSLYDAYSDSILHSSAPQMLKDYQLLTLQNDVLQAIGDYKDLLSHNYRNVKHNWDWSNAVPADSIPCTLSDEDYREVAGWFDISNPKLLLAGNEMGSVDWSSYGVKSDLPKSIRLFSMVSAKASDRRLEQSDLDTLKTLSNPFFAAACDSIYQRAVREYQILSRSIKATPTPEVDDDKVFDAIIEPHKGKVVVVDLWNTWCGPCRGALSATEPLKEKELNSDDIVWIYIADSSSDQIQYLKMIPEIRGIHYMLNKNQIKAIHDRFNVDGIPFYILVDKEGKAEARPDMRNLNGYINIIKSKL